MLYCCPSKLARTAQCEEAGLMEADGLNFPFRLSILSTAACTSFFDLSFSCPQEVKKLPDASSMINMNVYFFIKVIWNNQLDALCKSVCKIRVLQGWS